MAGLEEFYSGRAGFAPGRHRLSRGLKERRGENSSHLRGRAEFPPNSDGDETADDKAAPPSPHLGSAGAWDAATGEKYAGLGLGITGLIAENVLSHPFIVLRRQCQVNIASYHNHTTPITLLPVLISLHRWQGVSSLWKGLGSALTVKGLTLAAEDVASKFTPWPKEVDRGSSLRMLGQHLLLKAVSMGVVTPFFSASLVETVQSEIASERPGIFDVFKEGVSRFVCWQSPASGRMLPIWVLVPPTVLHGVLHYVVSTVAKGLAAMIMRRRLKEKQVSEGALAKDQGIVITEWNQYQDQISSLLGHLTADAILFPLETILHRLHLQGCRTIVDNLDSGREVIPIMTRYEGFFDCLWTVLDEEGARGLLKGFGALVLQYALHYALIRCSASIIKETVKMLRNEGSEAPPELKAKMLQQQQQQQQQVKTSTPLEQQHRPQQHFLPPASAIVANEEALTVRRRLPPSEEQLTPGSPLSARSSSDAGEAAGGGAVRRRIVPEAGNKSDNGNADSDKPGLT